MSRTNANPSAGNAGARQTLSGSSKSATNSRPALSEQDRRRGGRSPRRKGDRGEREIVARHLALNVRRNALSRPRCRCGRVRIGPQECSLVSDANRVRPPAVLCSLNAGLAKTICCFSAAITPSRLCCCRGGCGPRCLQRCGDEHAPAIATEAGKHDVTARRSARCHSQLGESKWPLNNAIIREAYGSTIERPQITSRPYRHSDGERETLLYQRLAEKDEGRSAVLIALI